MVVFDSMAGALSGRHPRSNRLFPKSSGSRQTVLIQVTAKDGCITFAVRVQPRASHSGVVGEHDGALKIRLAAPPVEGEANEELIRVLAKLFGVLRGQVSILSGQTSKSKLIRIDGLTAGEGERILQIATSC